MFEDKKLIELEENGTAEGARKWLLNTTTGMLGSHIRSSWKGDLFDSVEEARAFIDENGGGVRYFSVKNEDGSTQNVDLFLQFNKQWKVLKDGYMPIHHWIIERSALMMLELKRDLESVGYCVYNINTDCCDVNYNEETERNFKAKFEDKWFKSGTDWQQIGGLRVEHFDKPLRLGKKHDITSNDLYNLENVGYMDMDDDDDEVEQVELKPDVSVRKCEYINDGYDEWDVGSIHKVLGKACCIEAIYAGSGKSYISKKLNGKGLFITPNNKVATNLMKEGYDAITTDRLLGSRMTLSAERVEMMDGNICSKFNIGDKECHLFSYDYLTFDELTLNPIDKIYSIKKFIDKHSDKFKGIYLNYDPFQNKSPDEKLSNIDDVRAYKLKICRSIAGRYIILKQMKRNNNEENFKHYKAMFDLLGKNDRVGMIKYLLENCKVVNWIDDIKTDITIAYTNDQCDNINAHTYKRLFGNKPLSVGLKMIYKGKTQIVGKCKMRFFKNDEYEIVKIDDKNVVLKHLCGEETITRGQLNKLFKLPYCWTGHSTQGSTLDVGYTIDINSFWCDPEWLWTATTRCTDWSLITIYYNTNSLKQFENRIRRQAEILLNGYVEQDVKAKRWISSVNDYIDVEWFLYVLLRAV